MIAVGVLSVPAAVGAISSGAVASAGSAVVAAGPSISATTTKLFSLYWTWHLRPFYIVGKEVLRYGKLAIVTVAGITPGVFGPFDNKWQMLGFNLLMSASTHAELTLAHTFLQYTRAYENYTWFIPGIPAVRLIDSLFGGVTEKINGVLVKTWDGVKWVVTGAVDYATNGSLLRDIKSVGSALIYIVPVAAGLLILTQIPIKPSIALDLSYSKKRKLEK